MPPPQWQGNNLVPTQLRRELGLFSAILLGLGSMVGTGLFVSIGLGAEAAGPGLLLAIAVAAIVAACNGLSSAGLAASHPVSGGTYEYGYRYLNPALGFTAGWTFLIAKSASAATAALGFSGYLLAAFGIDSDLFVPVAFGITVLFTLIVLSGIRRSNQANTVIVSATLVALLSFVLCGLPEIRPANLALVAADGSLNFSLEGFLQACALMFVAYTGYGRVATMGEEVREPERTIPRAIIAVMVVTLLLYTAVSVVAIGGVGAATLGKDTRAESAPLAIAAATMQMPAVALLLTLGGMTAMLGVLLNLILGLSRVLLAMGRRGDFPAILSRLNTSGTTPAPAVIATGTVIAGLTLVGDVKATWSFSAFAVLVYYGITNLAALRLPKQERRYPRWISIVGLLSSLFLAFQVGTRTWLIGLGTIGAGLLWQFLYKRTAPKSAAGNDT